MLTWMSHYSLGDDTRVLVGNIKLDMKRMFDAFECEKQRPAMSERSIYARLFLSWI